MYVILITYFSQNGPQPTKCWSPSLIAINDKWCTPSNYGHYFNINDQKHVNRVYQFVNNYAACYRSLIAEDHRDIVDVCIVNAALLSLIVYRRLQWQNYGAFYLLDIFIYYQCLQTNQFFSPAYHLGWCLTILGPYAVKNDLHTLVSKIIQSECVCIIVYHIKLKYIIFQRMSQNTICLHFALAVE